MTLAKHVIRRAVLDDARPIANLAEQLGYPNTTDEIKQRLTELLSRDDHAVFVAQTDSRSVIGWVHVIPRLLLVRRRTAQIGGLVVDEGYRGRGVGGALLSAAEQWAGSRGCSMVMVKSNVVRSEAHVFYERQGYREIETQKAFVKALTS